MPLSCNLPLMKTGVMTILLSLGDDIKINMFLNKGFLNTMVIGET